MNGLVNDVIREVPVVIGTGVDGHGRERALSPGPAVRVHGEAKVDQEGVVRAVAGDVAVHFKVRQPSIEGDGEGLVLGGPGEDDVGPVLGGRPGDLGTGIIGMSRRGPW